MILLERFTRFEAGDGIWRQGRTLISSIVSHANRASGQLPGRARYLRYTQVLCTALERALILQLGALLAAGPKKIGSSAGAAAIKATRDVRSECQCHACLSSQLGHRVSAAARELLSRFVAADLCMVKVLVITVAPVHSPERRDP